MSKVREEQTKKFNPYVRNIHRVEIHGPTGELWERVEFCRAYFFECIGKVVINRDPQQELLKALMSYPATPYKVIVNAKEFA